jgi:CubicO group peptidase (beta-lactamase class C family)
VMRSPAIREGSRWNSALFRHAIVLHAFLFAAITSTHASDDKAGRSSVEALPPQTIEELKAGIEQILRKTGVPGAGIALVNRKEIVWAGGVGKADVAAGRNVTADTHFRIGSISKTVVAVALLRLAEEGKIDLNARLKQIAPEVEFENLWEATHPVRVVNLLEHTAGFDDRHPSESDNLTDPADLPLRDVLAICPTSRHSRWPPGTRMSYSSPGYAVAGYLIEKATGRPYEEYIAENVFAPLGMETASFRLSEADYHILAKGYQNDTLRPVPFYQIYLRPAGNLHASPREVAKFVTMLLNRGAIDGARILSAQSVSRMERVETTAAARAGLKEGYGLGIYSDPMHPVRFYGHDGVIHGFRSYLGYAPDYGFGYVVLLNGTMSSTALYKIREQVFSYMVRNLQLPAGPQLSLSENQLKRFEGYYHNTSKWPLKVYHPIDGATISVENGVLYQKFLFWKEALIPVAPNMFRSRNEHTATRIFFNDDNGKDVYAGSRFYMERVSPWPSRILLLLLASALIVMLTSPLFALIWPIKKILGRPTTPGGLSLRLWPSLGALSLAALFLLFSMTPEPRLGTLNPATATVWFLTWLFPVVSVAGLIVVISRVRQQKGIVVIYSLLVSTANCVVACYLAYWGVVGFQTWNY